MQRSRASFPVPAKHTTPCGLADKANRRNVMAGTLSILRTLGRATASECPILRMSVEVGGKSRRNCDRTPGATPGIVGPRRSYATGDSFTVTKNGSGHETRGTSAEGAIGRPHGSLQRPAQLYAVARWISRRHDLGARLLLYQLVLRPKRNDQIGECSESNRMKAFSQISLELLAQTL